MNAIFIATSLRLRSFQAYGRVHTPGRHAVVEPARGDGLGLSVELHHLFAVRAEIAELGTPRAGKTEERHGHGNGYVDAHLAYVDLVLEFARGGAALSENAGAVTEGIRIDQRDGVVERFD